MAAELHLSLAVILEIIACAFQRTDKRVSVTGPRSDGNSYGDVSADNAFSLRCVSLATSKLFHAIATRSHITIGVSMMGTTKVRKPSASPPQPRKLQKTGTTTKLPSAADLALFQLLHDSEDSQLRENDFNMLLDSVCSQSTLDGLLREPLAELMRRVDSKKRSDKLAALRNELLEAWTRRIMQATGDSLSEVMNLSQARAPITLELDGAKMEVRFMPVLENEDTEAAISETEEQERVAGEEQPSIDEHEEESDSSDSDSDSTVIEPHPVVGGGRMAVTPTRMTAQDMSILTLMPHLKQSDVIRRPSPTSSEERNREPPRRLRKPEQVEAPIVAEESESDEDEDTDEEDEHAESGPKATEAVRASTVGNEPQTPEDSVAGSDGDDQPNPSSRIVRFPAVDFPEMHLLCVETRSMQKASLRGKQAGGGFIGAGELATAIASANPGLPRPKVKLYCKRINLVSCETAEQARRMAARGFKFRGQTVKLSPFQPIRSQIFVSAMVCDKVDMSSAVHELLSTFPTTRLYVGTCPATNFVNGRKFLIVLEKQSDIRQFHLTLQTKNGAASSMQFDARIRAADEVICYACGAQHPLAECSKLMAANPATRHRRLLPAPPPMQLV
ncbi:hypothetical protein LTR56_004194 [Elasticomyces elasticus]|nr:hypothetical protein LTR56_004194 [Elasticomyces elasticus]KAK3655084.1 hypothetical protein LTR22_010393 [Elasticomyces elasticus]KAK5750298.1 hypothetical protein LTS12_019636 [Elasticomyces elasticus]